MEDAVGACARPHRYPGYGRRKEAFAPQHIGETHGRDGGQWRSLHVILWAHTWGIAYAIDDGPARRQASPYDEKKRAIMIGCAYSEPLVTARATMVAEAARFMRVKNVGIAVVLRCRLTRSAHA